MRMNPYTFNGSKVDEDPQCFIDEVFSVVNAKGVNPTDIAELTNYRQNDVALVWFE